MDSVILRLELIDILSYSDSDSDYVKPLLVILSTEMVPAHFLLVLAQKKNTSFSRLVNRYDIRSLLFFAGIKS